MKTLHTVPIARRRQTLMEALSIPDDLLRTGNSHSKGHPAGWPFFFYPPELIRESFSVRDKRLSAASRARAVERLGCVSEYFRTTGRRIFV